MKKKFIYIFSLCMFSMFCYINKADAAELYARIVVPGGQSAVDELTNYIHGEVDFVKFLADGIMEVSIKGKRFITHASNVILYDRY